MALLPTRGGGGTKPSQQARVRINAGFRCGGVVTTPPVNTAALIAQGRFRFSGQVENAGVNLAQVMAQGRFRFSGQVATQPANAARVASTGAFRFRARNAARLASNGNFRFDVIRKAFFRSAGGFRFAAASATTYANGFAARSTGRIPAGSIFGGAALAGVLVLVSLTSPKLRSVGNGGLVQTTDGKDIRFETTAGAKLPHIIDTYDPVAGSLVAWVRLPSLQPGVNNDFHCYAGKAGADEADPAGCAVDYIAWWNARTGVDYTGQPDRSLTMAGGPAAATVIGQGAAYDGVDDQGSVAPGAWFGGWSQLTMRVVCRPDASMLGQNRGLIVQGPATARGTECGIGLYFRSQSTSGAAVNPIFVNVTCGAGGSQQAFYVSESNQQEAVLQALTATWRSGEAPQLYKSRAGDLTHGILIPAVSGGTGIGTGTVAAMPAGSPGTIRIGRGPNTMASTPAFPEAGPWKGLIDEVRLRASAMTAAQIATEDFSMLDPASFMGWSDFDLNSDSNKSPTAAPDFANTAQNTSVLIDALANDLDPEGTAKVLVSTGAPTPSGTAVIETNKIRFTPSGGFSGLAEFAYTMRDSGVPQKTGTGQVLVQVGAAVVVEPSTELPTPLRTVQIANDAALGQYLAGTLSGGPQSGDQAVLAAGNYNTARTFSVAGTATNPIVYKSATVGGAKVSGEFAWNFNAADNTCWGVEFNGPRIQASKDRIKFIRVKTFNCPHAAFMLIGPSTGITFLYCDITTKPFPFNVVPPAGTTDRRGINVSISGSNAPRNVLIRRCYFHDFSKKPLPGNENYDAAFNTVLLTGEDAPHANISSKWIVEYNRFERCDCSVPNASGGILARVGTVECKSSDNIFRYNTYIDSPGLMTSRQGFGNQYISNWFEDCGGLSLYAGEEGSSRADTALSDRHLVLFNFVRESTGGLRTVAGTEATWSGKSNFQTASIGSLFIGNDSDRYNIGDAFGQPNRFPSLRTRLEGCRKGTGATFGSGTLITPANLASLVNLGNQSGTIAVATASMTSSEPVPIPASAVGVSATWVG